MLKSEIQLQLKEANLKIAELRINNTKLSAQLHTYTKEVEGLYQQSDNHHEQMKQISQSIHTMLKVKYPDVPNPEIGGMMVPSPDTEEKNFLMFLHELCANRNHNVNSLY